MKTLEKLERAGWVFLLNYAYYKVLARDEQRIMFDPLKDEVLFVYGHSIETYYPTEEEVEILCSKKTQSNDEKKSC